MEITKSHKKKEKKNPLFWFHAVCKSWLLKPQISLYVSKSVNLLCDTQLAYCASQLSQWELRMNCLNSYWSILFWAIITCCEAAAGLTERGGTAPQLVLTSHFPFWDRCIIFLSPDKVCVIARNYTDKHSSRCCVFCYCVYCRLCLLSSKIATVEQNHICTVQQYTV